MTRRLIGLSYSDPSKVLLVCQVEAHAPSVPIAQFPDLDVATRIMHAFAYCHESWPDVCPASEGSELVRTALVAERPFEVVLSGCDHFPEPAFVIRTKGPPTFYLARFHTGFNLDKFIALLQRARSIFRNPDFG